jgi:hypothetical protein
VFLGQHRVVLYVEETMTRTTHRHIIVEVAGVWEATVSITQLGISRKLIRPFRRRFSTGTDVFMRRATEQT